MDGRPQSLDRDTLTLSELLDKIDAAVARTSATSESRQTLLQCRAAIIYLAGRVSERDEVVTAGGIILP